MLNQVVLVGRLTADPIINKTENGKKVSAVVIAVQRTYKNSEGIYEADFVKCILWNNVAANTVEYCKKGDIVGIKGHIQVSSYETDDKTRKYITEVIAEKVTFLSSKKSEEN